MQDAIKALEKDLKRTLSFLESHYIRAGEAGEDHASYVVFNDLDDDRELCQGLDRVYQEYKKFSRSSK